MKNLIPVFNFRIFVIIALFVAFLFSGCNKDSMFFDTTELNQTENIFNSVKTIITPSDATDPLIKAQEDWHNINEAIQNAGEGGVVKLGAGAFYLHKSIIGTDFCGTLKGAGKKRTIIQTAPGIIFDVSEDPPLFWDNDWVSEGNAMFSFPQNYNTEERTLAILDLKIVANEPTTPWKRNVNGVGGPTTIHNNLIAVSVYYVGLNNDLSNPINLNVELKDLAIEGIVDPIFNGSFGTHYSMSSSIGVAGTSNGDLTIKGVETSNSTISMSLFVWNGEDSEISVKDSRITDTWRGIWSEINNKISIKNSEFDNCTRNGIILFQPSFGESIVKDNQFYNQGGVCISGIGVNDVKFADNFCSGNGFAALFARDSEGWEIHDNDMCDYDPFSPGGATIFLRNITESDIYNNSNQVIGGPSAGDPSNNIGEAIECE